MTAFEPSGILYATMLAQSRDFRFWTEEKLRNADTDQFRHVNNAAIATFFEAARMEIFASPSIRTLMGGANLADCQAADRVLRRGAFSRARARRKSVFGVGNTSFRVRQACLRGWTTTVARGRKPCASWFTAKPDVPIQSHLNCAHTSRPTTGGRLSHERKQGLFEHGETLHS